MNLVSCLSYLDIFQVYKPSGKGRRYIIYGAGSRNGWVGSPVVFPYKGDHKDYHNGMNAEHFEVPILQYSMAIGVMNRKHNSCSKLLIGAQAYIFWAR